MSLNDLISNKRVSWVRMFDIPDISKHKDGFTIYKVISLLYPESCPDAITRITVWKRFNDFKKLHKEIKALQGSLKIKSDIPSLPKSVIFKRFDEDTINQRKQGILNFLEYIGNHSQLFTSNVFVKFFETSHTPVELLNSNINAIRADLLLPEETDPVVNTDDEKNISDSDSFTSSNFGSVAQAYDNLYDTVSKSSTNLKKLNSMTSIDSQVSKGSESFSISNVDNSLLLLEDQYSIPVVPGIDRDLVQYLVDASAHVNMAIELESDRKYEEAFAAYKTAVDILINGGKNDVDYNRKRMVKYKTEKYLIRAEKIYNMFLAPEVKDLYLQSREEMGKPNAFKGPLFNLYKYKVIKIISPSGILVFDTEEQQQYYIKVIHKTVQYLNEYLILPDNVPYMIKLINHYNCENALFLVLEYCRGTKLRDYINNKSNTLLSNDNDELLRNIEEQSDNESEQSFSELINAYTSGRNKPDECIDDFEKIGIREAQSNKVDNIMDEPLRPLSTPDLMSLHSAVSSKTHCSEDGAVAKKLSEGDSSSPSLSDVDDVRRRITEQQIVKWASQLLIALEKLHDLGVICRDLKMENLLLDEGGNLVLTYMCNVKELCDLYAKGVNLNLAPEVYSFEEVTKAVDWWSFGAILYELLVGMPLSKVHANGITSYTHFKFPKYVSAEGKSLLKQLLTYAPNDRLGTGPNGTRTLRSHPFFRQVLWSTLEPRAF